MNDTEQQKVSCYYLAAYECVNIVVLRELHDVTLRANEFIGYSLHAMCTYEEPGYIRLFTNLF